MARPGNFFGNFKDFALAFSGISYCLITIQDLVKAGLASGKTGQAAGQGLYDWSKKDAADFRRRKQSPYFDGVKAWTMPK